MAVQADPRGAAAPPPKQPVPRAPRRRRGLMQYVGLLPATLLFGVCFFGPLALIVAYSFWQVRDYEVVHDWTLGNYTYLFSVPAYARTALWTIAIAAIATAITLVAAFPFAYWLARYVPRRLQRVLLVLVILPFWASYLLRVYAWIQILGDRGAINRFLEWSGVTHQPVSVFLYDRASVVLVLVYLYFPFAALTLFAALERFDWTQMRAAMDLGASPLVAMRRILLPQIRPGITTAIVFVFIPVLGEYLAPQLVGGTRGVMAGNLIVNFFQAAQYSRGAAAALLLAAVIVLLLVVFRRSLEIREVSQHGG